MCPLWLSAALSLNAVFTVEDFLNAVPKIQQLLRTVVDPDQSPAGSELARLHAHCSGNPNAVLNPFGFLAAFKQFVPCTAPYGDNALARIDAADEATRLLKKYCGSDRDSLIDQMLRTQPTTLPPPVFRPPASAFPTHGLPAIMPPPTMPPPAFGSRPMPPAFGSPSPFGTPMLPPPAKRPRTAQGINLMVDIVLRKYPSTDRDTIRARVITILKDRCTGCTQIRVANGTRVKMCTTVGCNRSVLHPSLAAEAAAI